MLGTPQEDIVSIAAVNALDIETKLLACIGFGIDTFHGVCHTYVLEAMADLIKQNAYHGVWGLTPEMPEVKRYREATDYPVSIRRLTMLYFETPSPKTIALTDSTTRS